MHLSMPRHRKVANPKIEEEEDDDCGRGTDKPGQRNAANARERARMRILSKAFSRLKTTLPWVPPDTKLSKLDTLRLATSYIAHLRTILMDDGGAAPIVHPLNLTWPFTIQQQGPDVRDAGNLGTGSAGAWSPGDRSSGAGTPSGGVEVVAGYGGEVNPDLDRRADGIPRHFCSRNRNLEMRLKNADSLLNL